jgi:hypothetical protein
MIEVLTSEKVIKVSDFDGIHRKTRPEFAGAAEATSKALGEGIVGETIFDWTSRALYRSQPIIVPSIRGTNAIQDLLEQRRQAGHDVVSNRPPIHEEFTRRDLSAMGVRFDRVMCLGFNPSLKIDYIRSLMEAGIDVVQLEDDPDIAIRVAALNGKDLDANSVAYLFHDHSGSRSRRGLVRVNSFEHVLFDLTNKVPVLR